MSTFASTYIYFPSKVAEIAILGWGGGFIVLRGVYCLQLQVMDETLTQILFLAEYHCP